MVVTNAFKIGPSRIQRMKIKLQCLDFRIVEHTPPQITPSSSFPFTKVVNPPFVPRCYICQQYELPTAPGASSSWPIFCQCSEFDVRSNFWSVCTRTWRFEEDVYQTKA